MAQTSAIHDFKRADNIKVISELNDTLIYPFAGGMNSCQFANMDINLDGIDDLLVFDRHGNRILPFLASSNPGSDFIFAPEYISAFPAIGQWIQAIDYDGDGKKDIFTYTTGGIKVFRNESGNVLQFKQVTQPFLLSQQGSTFTNILVTYADYPAITDIDSDGDFDILTFRGLGSFVDWHRNTSIERFGSSDSLTFEKSSSCWGHFAEGNEDNTIVLDTCALSGFSSDNLNSTSDDPKHTGSTLLAHDLNGDGLPDLTIGDVDFSNLVHLTNGGTLEDAVMTSPDLNFPNPTNPVNLNTFPAAMLADVNNDGRKDMLVSPFDPSLTKGENFKSVSLYLNNGSTEIPEYDFSTDSYLQKEMLDFGSGAYPVIMDYNGDGLNDLLVGNYGYSDTCIYSPATGLQCTFDSKIALLLNVGSAEKPVFHLTDRDIATLDTLHMQSLIPAVADMDGDGDQDLICGNSKGKFLYCENIALPGQPADFRLVDPAWQSIDVGDFSAPQLLDMDGDGLTDLLCGKRNGTISYYKNTGSKQLPVFTLISEKLGGVDVTNTQLSNYGFVVPCFSKDKQGNKILFAGSEFGEIYVYDQVAEPPDGDFRFLGILPGIHEGWRSGVAVGNLNNDTLSDIFVGNYSGGLGLFFGKPDKIFGISDPVSKDPTLLIISPNPAQDKIYVSWKSESAFNSGLILIHGIDGNVVKRIPYKEMSVGIDVTDLRNGVYLISLQTNKGIVTSKLVICR